MSESDLNNPSDLNQSKAQAFDGAEDFAAGAARESGAEPGAEAGSSTEENPSATFSGNSSGSSSGNVDATLKQVDEWKNKVIYLTAEMDNMRKRFARERAEVIKLSNEDLIARLLPVVDNLELAVKSIHNASADVKENALVANLAKGVEMTLKHFEQTLGQVGAQTMSVQGKAFDPTQHEAIGQVQSTDVANEHVATEVQRGWTLNGRVIRPARVLVNKLPNS